VIGEYLWAVESIPVYTLDAWECLPFRTRRHLVEGLAERIAYLNEEAAKGK
jgi:hypothetical protein